MQVPISMTKYEESILDNKFDSYEEQNSAAK